MGRETDQLKPKGTGWSVMGFNRAACNDCDWNRNDAGEPKASTLAAIRQHAREAGHTTWELRKQVRDFQGRRHDV